MPGPKTRPIQVKVCGMRELENIRAVAGLAIDYMGFIFYEKSSRFVGTLDPALLPTTGAIKRVGVFVNASSEEILQQVRQFRLDVVQLHGDELPPTCAALRQQLGDTQLMKAFRLQSEADLAAVPDYAPCCDFFLFDTKGKTYGGTGHRFDWAILKAYSLEVPFFLSGGIGPDALPELLQFRHPACIGIDVNSGFELSPGLKAVDRLRSFLQTFKNQD